MDSADPPKVGTVASGGKKEKDPNSNHGKLEEEKRLRIDKEQLAETWEKNYNDLWTANVSLTDKCDKLDQKLKEVRDEVTTNNARNKSTQQDLYRANEEAASLRGEIEDLRKSRSDKAQKLGENKQTIKDLETQVRDMMKQLDEQEIGLLKAHDEGDKYQMESLQNTALLEQHTEQIDGLRRDLEMVVQERGLLMETVRVFEDAFTLEGVVDLEPDNLRDILTDWRHEHGPGPAGVSKPPKTHRASMADELEGLDSGDEEDGEGTEDGEDREVYDGGDVSRINVTCPHCEHVHEVDIPAALSGDDPLPDASDATATFSETAGVGGTASSPPPPVRLGHTPIHVVVTEPRALAPAHLNFAAYNAIENAPELPIPAPHNFASIHTIGSEPQAPVPAPLGIAPVDAIGIEPLPPMPVPLGFAPVDAVGIEPLPPMPAPLGFTDVHGVGIEPEPAAPGPPPIADPAQPPDSDAPPPPPPGPLIHVPALLNIPHRPSLPWWGWLLSAVVLLLAVYWHYQERRLWLGANDSSRRRLVELMTHRTWFPYDSTWERLVFNWETRIGYQRALAG